MVGMLESEPGVKLTVGGCGEELVWPGEGSRDSG